MELEPNKKKTVVFEIELSGTNPSTLKGFLRLSLNGIEYGIPAKIMDKTILIDIPILKDIIENIEYQKKIEGKLEIFHGENYIVPWSGEFTIKSPLVIQVKTKEKLGIRTKTESPVVIKVKMESDAIENSQASKENLITEPIKEVINKKENIDSLVTEGMIINYIKKQGSKDEKIIKTIIEQCKTKAKGDSPADTLREVIKFFQINKKSMTK